MFSINLSSNSRDCSNPAASSTEAHNRQSIWTLDVDIKPQTGSDQDQMCVMCGYSNTQYCTIVAACPHPLLDSLPWSARESPNDIINHSPLPAVVPSRSPFSWASNSARLMYSSCRAVPLFHPGLYHFIAHRRHTHTRNCTPTHTGSLSEEGNLRSENNITINTVPLSTTCVF